MMHSNDDHRPASDILRCPTGELESVRAWLLVELMKDDVDHGALLADLAVCDHRIEFHGLRLKRSRSVLRTLG